MGKEYECLLAIDLTVPASDVEALLGRVKQAITQDGGEVVSLENVGTRKLAFKVRGKSDAAFHHIVFKAASAAVGRIADVLRLHEGVLRYMTTRVTGPYGRQEAPRQPQAEPAA